MGAFGRKSLFCDSLNGPIACIPAIMSNDHSKIEVDRFLATAAPEVLVIAGKWGVGKTYAWNQYLSWANAGQRISLTKYTYVSLFGLNNLNDIKDAIFQNTVPIAAAGNAPNFTTFEASLTTIKANWRKGGGLARMFPVAESYAPFVAKMGFFSLNRQIVCIDDLERRGITLAMRDVLGLVSQLKEEKNCKIVLLLNDEKLGDDDTEFRTQLEKIADTQIRFEPTADEAATIGLDDFLPFHENLKADCIGLGIVNIRTIKKLERIASRLSEGLEGFDARVLEQAIHSASLFEFSKLHPDVGPDVEFLRSYNKLEGLFDNDNRGLPNAPWRTLLNEYGFSGFDEFDNVILDGLEAGHFDGPKLRDRANELQSTLRAQDADNSFSKAWRLFHDSFEDNADEVMSKLAYSVEHTPKAVTPNNLSGAIELLKELGWSGDVSALITSYIAGRDDGRDFWDLANQHFGYSVKDPDVRVAFVLKLATFHEHRNFSQILIEMGKKNGYNPSDFEFLASHNAVNLYNLFKSLQGDDLHRAIDGALWLKDAAEYPKMHELALSAEEALQKLGSESAINRSRVARYGIMIENSDCGAKSADS